MARPAPLALAGLPLAVYLPVVYADSGRFRAVAWRCRPAAGMLSRISDVVTDPLIGYLSDKLEDPLGAAQTLGFRRHTDLSPSACGSCSSPPFEFSDVTVFGQTFSNGYIWLFVTLTVFFIGSTIKDIPFSAWGAELSSSYNERSLIMSWREGLGTVGSLISAFTPLTILFFGLVRADRRRSSCWFSSCAS